MSASSPEDRCRKLDREATHRESRAGTPHELELALEIRALSKRVLHRDVEIARLKACAHWGPGGDDRAGHGMCLYEETCGG